MTIALSIGRALGYTGAAVVHGACVSASYTGRFGAELVEGTSAGYADNAARLAALRAARPVRSIAITVTPALKAKTAKA